MSPYKISFCTVCMNRLHHLKQTLPENILNNINYPNIEFLLFDYNSSDGLEDWVQTEMKEWIEKGILKYYKTKTPQYFDRSHSRNVMFKLASGDIICNIDADNFTGINFAPYINKVFSENFNVIIVPDTTKEIYYLRDALGRFCARKDDFLKVGGYDEAMSGYGFEDDDLYERLIYLGRDKEVIKDLNFLKALKHDNEERVKNEFYSTNISDVFINYCSTSSSDIIFLYKDNSFEKGIVVPNNLNTPTPVLIENFEWRTGKWETSAEGLVLSSEGDKPSSVYIKDNNEKLSYFDIDNNSTKEYFRVTGLPFLANLPYDLSLIKNQGKYLLNKKNKNPKINEEGFGMDDVYLNFSNKAMPVI